MAQRVGVHYDFATGKLSVRELRPSGTLGRVLFKADEVFLKNVKFRVNQERLKKWRNGNKHARQFAEAVGHLATKKDMRWLNTAVYFNPRTHDHFCDDDGVPVRYGARAHITPHFMKICDKS